MLPIKNDHKTIQEIEAEIAEAKTAIRVNGIYSHFKDPESRYIVTGFGITESDDGLCVLYRRADNANFVFVRPVASWLEQKEVNGKLVDRFQLIN